MCWCCIFFLTDRSKRVVVRCSLPLMLHCWHNKKDVHSHTHCLLYIFISVVSGANAPKWVMYLLRVFCAKKQAVLAIFQQGHGARTRRSSVENSKSGGVAERVASLYYAVTSRPVFCGVVWPNHFDVRVCFHFTTSSHSVSRAFSLCVERLRGMLPTVYYDNNMITCRFAQRVSTSTYQVYKYYSRGRGS